MKDQKPATTAETAKRITGFGMRPAKARMAVRRVPVAGAESTMRAEAVAEVGERERERRREPRVQSWLLPPGRGRKSFALASNGEGAYH